MKKYIFVTPDGLTYKPNCDSPDPDFLDMQIVGFGRGSPLEETLDDLIDINEGAPGGQPEWSFSLRIVNKKSHSLWLREPKPKIPLAS